MTRQTMVQLTDDLVARLDEEVRHRRCSRSAIIREAIEEHLATRSEEAISRAIVEGYTRIPQGTPDRWGDLGDHNAVTARDVMLRLAEEERVQGFEPW